MIVNIHPEIILIYCFNVTDIWKPAGLLVYALIALSSDISFHTSLKGLQSLEYAMLKTKISSDKVLIMMDFPSPLQHIGIWKYLLVLWWKNWKRGCLRLNFGYLNWSWHVFLHKASRPCKSGAEIWLKMEFGEMSSHLCVCSGLQSVNGGKTHYFLYLWTKEAM